MKKLRILINIFFILIILSIGGIIVAVYINVDTKLDPEYSEAATPDGSKYTMRERFGVGGAVATVNGVNNPLNMGWFFNWGVSDSSALIHTHNMAVDYMPVIGTWSNVGYPGDGTSKTCEQFKADFAKNPYAYNSKTSVIIGNEIGWDVKLTPQQYAVAFNAWKNCFRSFNPKIRVGSAAMLWEHGLAGGKVGEEYFKEFINILRTNYGGDAGLPDFIVMHGYSARDLNNPDYVIEIIKDIRKEMAALNLRNKDLVIKEFGPLSSPSQDFSNSYMDKTVNFFASAKDPNTGNPEDSNRLVQRWAWFVSNESKTTLDNTPTWRNLILFDQDNGFAITPVGIKYKQLIDKYVSPDSTCRIQGYKKVFGDQAQKSEFENATITVTGNGQTQTCNSNPCIFNNLEGNKVYNI